MKEYLIAGKITGTHGVGGDMKFLLLSDASNWLSEIRSGYLADKNEIIQREIRITSWRQAGGRIFFHVEGIDSREDAVLLSGLYFAIKREDVPKPPPGRFFITDLIGCKVIDREKGELGIVNDVLQTGANDVFSIKRKGKKDLLIPYLNTVVLSVDLRDTMIHVDLPDGLLEIYGT